MKTEFKILGPPEIYGIGTSDARLSPKLWCVLATLLLAEGKPVSVESLVDHLWGGTPTPGAVGTLRTYVYRINAVLAQGGLRIARRAGGYQLPVDPQAVDLHKFRSLRRQAESVARSGDLVHAAALLKEADELWRGDLLMGVPGEWVSARRHALDDERYEAVRRRIGIELDLGRQAGVLGELRELAERDPFDEEIARYLMTALYRQGRHADAIGVGRDVSVRYTEAGMEPSSQFREVHTRILRGDAGLGVTPAYRRSDQVGQPNTLPPKEPHFVGRAEEVELLTTDHQGNAPLLTVIEGMAGVGKTALAIQAAHSMATRYPDAQLFLGLSGYNQGDAGEALYGLLRMLGVPAERIPAGISERTKLWRAEMAHRRAVVVLDDVPSPDQVAPIALTAGDSLTIVTSRRHANWPGQRVIRLEPLKSGDSIELLRRLADLALLQHPGKVAKLTALCGGLPLAIRVAAGTLQEGDSADLDGLIGDLTDVSAGRAGGTDTGNRIFSTFEVTYRQLAAEEKRVFRLLGTSPCVDFCTETAAAISGDSMANVATSMRVLCYHSLLEPAPGDRYRFHELIRSYAATRGAQEETEAENRRAIGRLIQYYSDVLRAATSETQEIPLPGSGDPSVDAHDRPPDQLLDADAADAWLAEEWRNILLTARHAAGHERHRQCADLTHFLAGYLETSGYWIDAVRAHEVALQACRLLGDPARAAKAALDLSATCYRTGDHDKARGHADEALTSYNSLGNRRGQAAALDQLGVIHRNFGSVREALAHHQEAADLYREVADTRGAARAVMHAANAFGALGRYAEETRGLEKALGLFQQVGDRRGVAKCLNNIGAVLDDQGMHRDAVAYYEKSIAIFREIHGRQNLALLGHNLGCVQQYKGNYDKAIEIYREALADYYAMGDLQHQAGALADIGTAFVSKELYSEALVHYEKSAELAQTIGDMRQLAVALCGMGEAYRGSGSYEAATEKYDKAHRIAAEIEAPYLSGKALYGMAETLLITQGIRAGKIYLRQALDIFAQLGVQEAAIVELRLQGLGADPS